MLLRHPCRHAGAPVAALGDVACVAQALHQHGPRSRDARQTPSAFGGLVREAEAGERRYDDVESVLGSTALSRGIGQGAYDLEELND